MATLKPELKAILTRYEIDPRDKSQVWDCHGVLVLYHKAYEIIAAKEGIRFDPPTIIEGNGADLKVAMVVVGHMGDRAEWSVGEASPLNYKVSGKQQAFPYAMAEKRAKDRVVAKLVGLAAYVYSEAEADEFRTGERTAVEHTNGTGASSPTPKPSTTPAPLLETANRAKETAAQFVEREAREILTGIRAPDAIDKLDQFMDQTMDRRHKLPQVTQQFLSKTYLQRREAMIAAS